MGLLCTECYCQLNGADYPPLDLIYELDTPREIAFQMNLLKGNIGELIVQTLLQMYNYIVFPFGYENYKTSLINLCSIPSRDVAIRMVRSSPDLFVYDKDDNIGFLAEIKATNLENEANYCIKRDVFQHYHTFWPETILIVYCIQKHRIHCRKVLDFNIDELEERESDCPPQLVGEEYYKFNLNEEFFSIPSYFHKVDRLEYKWRLGQIINTIVPFC